MKQSRRRFLQLSFQNVLGVYLGTNFLESELWAQALHTNEKLKLAVQSYSLAPLFLSGALSIKDFPQLVSNEFGVSGAEYWNLPLAAHRKDASFLKELKLRALDVGVTNTLMLIDLINLKDRNRGPSLVSSQKEERSQAVVAHQEWMDVAKSIGCSAVRVNLWSEGMAASEVTKTSEESLGKLLEYGTERNISVVIENHGGYTSDAQWLVALMKQINHPMLGTLPDFGTSNFCVERAPAKAGEMFSQECLKQYDKYEGVAALLPYAKGISAKSRQFDSRGEEVETDFKRMLDLIKVAGFEGYIAIEYEGGMMGRFGGSDTYLPPKEGVLATKALLNKYL
ncbi:MAG: sugar phosphate isomerase/epimerase family protein [Flavobacteriaceae bacterium]